ncbi:MAG: hypothetical protein Q8R05_04325 [Candidatus Omnitrophota bacterium]|nr:hypothetical protein [Candidatus Omnitrophota bacterium]
MKGDRQMKYAVLILMFLAAATSLNGTYAAQIVWENFEGDNYWEPVDWENTGQVNISVSDAKASEGSQSLEIIVREEATDWKNKVAFYREEELDLSNANIVMDVYSEKAAAIEVATGFRVGEKWAYYESNKKPVNQGWNKDITFDLGANDFKSKATDWKYMVPLADRDSVKEIYVLVYRPAKMIQDVIYIDNIRFK